MKYKIIGSTFLAMYILFFRIGLKLIKNPDDKTFILGVIAAAVMILLAGYFNAISVLGAVGQLYNLTSSI